MYVDYLAYQCIFNNKALRRWRNKHCDERIRLVFRKILKINSQVTLAKTLSLAISLISDIIETTSLYKLLYCLCVTSFLHSKRVEIPFSNKETVIQYLKRPDVGI